jgi:hypothetical protein
MKIHPVRFNFSKEAQEFFKLSPYEQHGLSAQQVKVELPAAVIRSTQAFKLGSQAIEGLHLLNTTALIADLIGALQACNHKIDVLQEQVAHLKSEITRLKSTK